MNSITPLSRKGYKKTHIILTIVVLALISAGIVNYVNADSQTTSEMTKDEQLTTLNAQINEIEKKLMVRSQEYNENQKIISEKEARNMELNNQNTEDRKLKSELEAKKAELISWK